MPIPILILRQVLGTVLLVMELLLFVQAILSWIVRDGTSNRFFDFIDTAGNAMTAPMRLLLERFEFVRSCPLDLSFLATVLVLNGLRMVIL